MFVGMAKPDPWAGVVRILFQPIKQMLPIRLQLNALDVTLPYKNNKKYLSSEAEQRYGN